MLGKRNMFRRAAWLVVGLIAAVFLTGCDSGDSGTTPPDYGLGFDSQPEWSPDGSKIVFTSQDLGDRSTLYVVDSKGGPTRALTLGGSYAHSPSWSPDGNEIVFVRDDYDEGQFRSSELFVIRDDGSGSRRLTRGGQARDPTSSPDGKRIALMKGRDMFVIKRDGGGARSFTGEGGLDLAWAPDGKRIAFSTGDTLEGEIYVLSIVSGRKHRLFKPPLGMIDVSPTWSPDGKAIAVERYASVGCSMLRPDYDECVASAYERERHAVAVLRMRGKRSEWVPTGREIPGSEPAWSPDGRKIAFIREFTVFVMNADGTGVRRLTNEDATQ